MNNPIEVNITTLLVNIQWRRDVYFLEGRRQQRFFLRIDALRELEDAILTISGRFELYEKNHANSNSCERNLPTTYVIIKKKLFFGRGSSMGKRCANHFSEQMNGQPLERLIEEVVQIREGNWGKGALPA